MPFLLSFGVLLSSGSPIDLDGSFFVQLAIFFIAFLILRSLVFRPVMALFDARAEAMQGARKQASEMERGADEKREHLESELRRVRQKASDHSNELRGKAQQLARELTDRARRENAAALQSAKAQLDVEARDAHAKARNEAPTIARQIAERLLGRSLS